MKPYYIPLLIGLLLLKGCSSEAGHSPKSIEPERLSPACEPSAKSLVDNLPLKDVNGFVHKVIVTNDGAKLYRTSSSDDGIETLPIWTYLQVHERSNGRCRVSYLAEGSTIGWIDQTDLDSWVHTVSVRVKVNPSKDAKYYLSIESVISDTNEYKSGYLGDSTLPVLEARDIDTDDRGKIRVYKVLATLQSSNNYEPIEVWISPDNDVFEFVIISTRRSLQDASTSIRIAIEDLKLRHNKALNLNVSMVSKGMPSNNTDIGTYLSMCSNIPLPGPSSLDRTVDINDVDISIEEHERSLEKIETELSEWGNYRIKPIPISVFPLVIDDSKEYKPCSNR